MMQIRPFLDDDFLLDNDVARSLYHDYAAQQPIIDYHNHLSPADVAQDRIFDSITDLWIEGDHYKWRAMRTSGVGEQYITGQATVKEKFDKWAEIVPKTIRNPLFHWTHLELRRYFDIDLLLSPSTSDKIYERTNELTRSSEFSARSLLHKMNVEVICTTDDPCSDLSDHKSYAKEGDGLHMSMTFRPDNILSIEKNYFLDYMQQLEKAADIEISNFTRLKEGLVKRLNYFHGAGCRLSDHGLSYLYARDYSDGEVDLIFRKVRGGEKVSPVEIEKYKSAILLWLCEQYADRGWVQQFHLGPLRNNNHVMFNSIGSDTGFDSIGAFNQAQPMVTFLNKLNNDGKLTKTILYNLNPKDSEVFVTMAGNFNEEGVIGKVQYGAAWWYLDQKDGIEEQLKILSNFGLLSSFVGMLTDSRSLLSFPRHEYYRRILCNLIGRDVHHGELPHDIQWLGGIVKDLCYQNAKKYFRNLGLPKT